MKAYFTGGGPLSGHYGMVPDNQDTFTTPIWPSDANLKSAESPDEIQPIGHAVYRNTGRKIAKIFIFELEPSSVN